jgi:hypothetical protein
MEQHQKRTVTSRTKGAKGPTTRQRDILEAYLANPNAAAVERATGTDERHVRRLVKQFADYLEVERQVRYAERFARESARLARIQDWIDDTLEDDLRRLDELAASKTEGVALRALKAKFELAASFRISAARRPNILDGRLADLESALTDEIADLADGGSAA